MLLASSLEPTGPKSTGHFLILHHEKQRNLIRLPKSYSDLKKQVASLYHVDPNRFYVENKELNLCAGERIRIPEELWGDISELLGNVYVVPLDDDSHPESAPETGSHEVSANQGTIALSGAFGNDHLLAINLGHNDFHLEPTPSMKLDIKVLDEQQNSALTVSILPHTSSMVLASATNVTNVTMARPITQALLVGNDCYILIHKQENRFTVLSGSEAGCSVDAPANSRLTTVSYDFGIHSLFLGPVSAEVYPGFFHFCADFGPYQALSPSVVKEMLFQQIVAGDVRNAVPILNDLEGIRREITSNKSSRSGTKWQSQVLSINSWAPLKWSLLPRTVFVIRYRLQNDVPGLRLGIQFGTQNPSTYSSLDIGLKSNTAVFSEYSTSGSFDSYLTSAIANSMHTAGDHTISLVHHDGQVRVSFGFQEFHVLPRTTLFNRMPKNIFVNVPSGSIVETDVYNFGS